MRRRKQKQHWEEKVTTEVKKYFHQLEQDRQLKGYDGDKFSNLFSEDMKDGFTKFFEGKGWEIVEHAVSILPKHHLEFGVFFLDVLEFADDSDQEKVMKLAFRALCRAHKKSLKHKSTWFQLAKVCERVAQRGRSEMHEPLMECFSSLLESFSKNYDILTIDEEDPSVLMIHSACGILFHSQAHYRDAPEHHVERAHLTETIGFLGADLCSIVCAFTLDLVRMISLFCDPVVVEMSVKPELRKALMRCLSDLVWCPTICRAFVHSGGFENQLLRIFSSLRQGDARSLSGLISILQPMIENQQITRTLVDLVAEICCAGWLDKNLDANESADYPHVISNAFMCLAKLLSNGVWPLPQSDKLLRVLQTMEAAHSKTGQEFPWHPREIHNINPKIFQLIPVLEKCG
jgi:hypothetical protein